MKNSDKRPNVRPVQKIELSANHPVLRIVLIAVLLVIAAVALSSALMGLLNTEPGWQVIEVASDQRNCSSEFTLNYDLTGTGSSASAIRKELTSLYTEATVNAYRIFTADEAFDGVGNVRAVNDRLNEDVVVDAALYEVFRQIQEAGNRCLYLAPVYVEYDRIFSCDSEEEAAQYDPAQEPELMDYIRQAAAYANDPEMIDLELLGDNTVRLRVSEEYLAFAEECGLNTLVDFHWMKNAFIADYIAGILLDHGYTSGYLASYDGFTRNLDERGQIYNLNLFDRRDNTIYRPGTMSYSGPLSIVSLRNYPMSDMDKWNYYSFSNGRIVTVFIDPADGVSKSATDNLVSYAVEAGCGQILLRMIPAFLADEFSEETISAMASDGIWSVWGEGNVLCYNDPALNLTLSEDAGYSVRKN